MPRDDLFAERLILTDVDETVLSFCPAFEAWMAARGIPAHTSMRNSRSYAMTEVFPIFAAQIPALLNEFFTTDLGGEIAAEPDAKEVLPRLYRGGWRFVAISASPDDPAIGERRRRNLEQVFGFPWEAVHCIGLGGDKAATLRRYPPTLWVEDHHGHAMRGAEIGHTTFLLDRPYNQMLPHPRVRRVADWQAIWQALH